MLLLMTACAPIPESIAASPWCVASVYWEGFGRPLADSKRHSPDEMLIAHRTLPLGSRVRVTVKSGRSVVAHVRDRGPFVRGRCVDLSRGTAHALGVSGLPHVTIEPLP
jgi:rare lipoprotein A